MYTPANLADRNDCCISVLAGRINRSVDDKRLGNLVKQVVRFWVILEIGIPEDIREVPSQLLVGVIE